MYPKYGIGKRINSVMSVAADLYAAADDLCDHEIYNLVLHKHLGDVLYGIASKRAFETTHHSRIRYIIRPKHAFIAEMYGICDYKVLDMDKYVLGNDVVKEALLDKEDPKPHEADFVENCLFQALFSCLPLVGKPFVCENNIHAYFDDQRTDGLISFQLYWAYRWAANMGVDETFRFPQPTKIPTLSAKAEQTLNRIGKLDKIIVLAPEAATAAELEVDFWNILAKVLHKSGYKIIVNSKKFKVDYAVSTYDLDLSLVDVVSLCFSSAYVFAIRSGLCDVIASLGSRLYVFYPSMLQRELNGLNYVFEHASPVNEISILDWKIDPVLWENEDLSPVLQKDINRLKIAHNKLSDRKWFSRGHRHDLAYRRSYYEELVVRTGHLIDNNAQKRILKKQNKQIYDI